MSESAGRKKLKRGSSSDEGVASAVQLRNPFIPDITVDHLYHLGLSSHDPLKEMFGDVRIVAMGGSPSRMKQYAEMAVEELGLRLPVGMGIANISSTDRYSMFKVGPVLAVNHGMGNPSISILLHEVAKLLHYAEVKDVRMVRVGTSGGIGVEPGSCVVSDKVVNGMLQPEWKLAILGKEVTRPTDLDSELLSDLVKYAPKNLNVVVGHTMCCDDFYEGQGRTDGALCEYTNEQKLEFLKRAYDVGVRNIEMESLVFSSFCRHVGIRGAVVCTTLLDRLQGDQVSEDHDKLKEFGKGPLRITFAYIRNVIMESWISENPSSPFLKTKKG